MSETKTVPVEPINTLLRGMANMRPSSDLPDHADFKKRYDLMVSTCRGVLENWEAAPPTNPGEAVEVDFDAWWNQYVKSQWTPSTKTHDGTIDPREAAKAAFEAALEGQGGGNG